MKLKKYLLFAFAGTSLVASFTGCQSEDEFLT